MKTIFFILSFLLFAIFSYNVSLGQCVNIQYTGSYSSYSHLTPPEGYLGSINEDCGTLNGGPYTFYQYIVWFDVYGDFSNATIDVNEWNSSGWNGVMDEQTQCPWGGCYYYDPTRAMFYTYVYHLYTFPNSWDMGWYPCTIQNARVAYQVCKNMPTITFASNMPKTPEGGMYKLGKGSHGWLAPADRTNMNCYLWSLMKCSPTGISLVLPWDYHGVRNASLNNGFYFMLENYGYDNFPCEGDAGWPEGFALWENVTVWNHQGGCPSQSATSIRIQPLTTAIGGCPWLWVYSDSDLVPENNVLHKSEFSEYFGNDITDMYIIQNKPQLDENNNILIELAEADNDYTYF